MSEKIEARQIAAAYYTAWTAGDFDEMMTWVADDVVCETPSGLMAGPRSFRRFRADFASRTARDFDLIALYGDVDSAAIVYSCDMGGADGQCMAEWISVRHGKIARSLMIYDQGGVSGLGAETAPRSRGVLAPA